MNEQEIRGSITDLKSFWQQRNLKFKEWYETLVMVDTLATKGLESYVSNEPQTFYDMAHYLLTRGDLSHSQPIETESAVELEKRARVDRACQYLWKQIDRERQAGGNMPYLDELGFFMLVLGWYATIFQFDNDTGLLKSQIWNPFDTYPYFANGQLAACVHSYKLTESEARFKAEQNGWDYGSGTTPGSIASTQSIILDDYWLLRDGEYWNAILYNSRIVDGWTMRPNIKLMVAPIAGFPDRGSLAPSSTSKNWKKLVGRGIFEVNEPVTLAFNKWKTMVSQILRDTAQPVTQEFSASPQATPEQLRERGALFHYAPGEKGIERLPPAAIPIELQAHMMEIRRELQKGSFNDAVYGMIEGQPGYALSMMASSSANQILYPYMDAKHFVVGETDSFWLSKLKTSKRVFEVKGKFIEKLRPTDIPEDVSITVESDVATPKDWLERSTIANYLKEHLDPVTILKEILNQKDPQAIIRQKDLYEVLHSPEAMTLKKISGFRQHARYLEFHGDREQARSFKGMADALEAQMGAPPPGQGAAPQMGRIEAQRQEGSKEGAPAERPGVSPGVAPPEAVSGFTPQQLRNIIGSGRAIRR